MAELLIVVAILGVLAGVSFVAVQTHQKNVTQLQYDAIAKEIFVAAQNHLTLAKSENYGQKADLTSVLDSTTDSGAYFFGWDGKIADGDNPDIRYFYSGGTNAGTALDQILPFGAVELVSGGSFIIRYQPISARVLDVFYWTNDSRYGLDLNKDDYADLVQKYTGDAHKDYPGGILGWFGGEVDVVTGEYLETPVIEVINEEMLLVKVSNPNAEKTALSPMLKLIVEGTYSGAKVAIPLTYPASDNRVNYNTIDKEYAVVLDDITADKMHFNDLNTINTNFTYLMNGSFPIAFVPGENLKIQAVAYSNTVLTSVAYSGEWTVNSLFGEVTEDVVTSGETVTAKANKVSISNIRHLENLNESISSLAYAGGYFTNASRSITNTVDAVQTVDLDWDDFKQGVNQLKIDYIDNSSVALDDPINIYNADGDATKDDCYLPVDVAVGNTLIYEGQTTVTVEETQTVGGEPVTSQKTIIENHSIKGVVVDSTVESGNPAGADPVELTSGGMFGTLSGATIKNLELINTSVNLTSGSAGTLAGSLAGSVVENVVAYNTSEFEDELGDDLTTVTSAAGDAGGLIGSISSKTAVRKSAAAVVVNATGGNAGGLIGTATSTGEVICTITGCYAGGHTEDDDLTGSRAVVYNETNYNVTATATGTAPNLVGGTAGGLIGAAGATTINYSYSTCSVTGATAGGLIGTGNAAITNSYCTGLVSGTTEGAFAGSWTYTGRAATDGNSYFEIINEREETYGDDDTPTGGYTYLRAVGNVDETETIAGLSAFDETAATFNKFSFDTGDANYAWQPATPYNITLTKYYGEGSGTARVAKFILKTVAQLGDETVIAGSEEPVNGVLTQTPADFVATHYGDWPAPEIFVINTK